MSSPPNLKGRLLIASSTLIDPNFTRTVIFMVQHEEQGALGLVLNRPLELTVRQACEQVLETSCTVEGALHQGGPCEGPLMVLHTEPIDGALEAMDGIYFTTERSKIESLLSHDSTGQARYFVGYAGWGPGQIEQEIEIGSWLSAPADVEIVFESDESLWDKLTQKLLLGRWIDPGRIPDDPSMN